MGKKHILMNKKRWANIPKEERSRRMSIIAHAKYSKMSIEERKEIGKKLAISRKAIKSLVV